MRKNNWMIWSIVGGVLWVVFSSTTFAADQTLYTKAEAFAGAGDAAGMELVYEEILSSNPEDLRALIGRATARAWQGRYNDARIDYRRALAKDPRNLEALVGLGYAHAWDGSFDPAEDTFRRALEIAPNNIDARKGLGYTYLWSDRGDLALEIFSRMAREMPGDPESHVAVGLARLSLGQAGRASRSFEDALVLDPGRGDALSGLQAARHLPPLAELHLWGGNTSGGGDAGLRLVELATWLNARTRLGARYDNSLSLDNPALARSGQEAETYQLSLFRQLNDSWLGTVELGMRDLPGDADQDIYKLEVVRLLGHRTFKVGTQLSEHSAGYTEDLYYGAYGIQISDRWRLEPTLFIAQTGQMSDDEWRGIVNAEYVSPDGWSLGLGAGGGIVSSDMPALDGSVRVANARFSIPISAHHSVHFSVRYEDAPGNEFTVAMIGISLRLPRR